MNSFVLWKRESSSNQNICGGGVSGGTYLHTGLSKRQKGTPQSNSNGWVMSRAPLILSIFLSSVNCKKPFHSLCWAPCWVPLNSLCLHQRGAYILLSSCPNLVPIIATSTMFGLFLFRAIFIWTHTNKTLNGQKKKNLTGCLAIRLKWVTRTPFGWLSEHTTHSWLRKR